MGGGVPVSRGTALKVGEEYLSKAKRAEEKRKWLDAAGQYKEAVRNLLQATKESSNAVVQACLSDAHFRYGKVLKELQRNKQAREQFQKALGLKHEKADAELKSLPDTRVIFEKPKLSTTTEFEIKNTQMLAGELSRLKLLVTDERHSKRYGLLMKLAFEVIRKFDHEDARPELVAELTALAIVPDKEVISQLLNKLTNSFEEEKLINVNILGGIADAVKVANPALLDVDKLKQILKILHSRLAQMIKDDLGDKTLISAIDSISQLLNAMVKAGIKCLSEVERRLPLNDSFEELSKRSNKRLAYQASYAQQALARVPSDESKAMMALRKSILVGKGTGTFLQGVKDLDPSVLLEVYGHIQEAAKAVGPQKDWYRKLLHAEDLIRSNQLEGFERYVMQEAASRMQVPFTWGIIQQLRAIIKFHTAISARQNALEFLGEIFLEREEWGDCSDIQREILYILTDCAAHAESDELRNSACTVLQRIDGLTENEEDISLISTEVLDSLLSREVPDNFLNLKLSSGSISTPAFPTTLFDRAKNTLESTDREAIAALKDPLTLTAASQSMAAKSKQSATQEADLGLAQQLAASHSIFNNLPSTNASTSVGKSEFKHEVQLRH